MSLQQQQVALQQQQQQQQKQQVIRAKYPAKPLPDIPFCHVKSFDNGYWKCDGCNAWLHPVRDADKIGWYDNDNDDVNNNSKRRKRKGILKYRFHIKCPVTGMTALSRIRYHVRGTASRKRRDLMVPRY